MREGPDISRLAALIGDPARANILTALMGGQALTATELAEEAGIALPTASQHISKLVDAGLLTGRKQGRHKYLAIASPDVAAVLEALMGLAESQGLAMAVFRTIQPRTLYSGRPVYQQIPGYAG